MTANALLVLFAAASNQACERDCITNVMKRDGTIEEVLTLEVPRDGFTIASIVCADSSTRNAIEELKVEYKAERGISILSSVYYHPFDPLNQQYWILIHGSAEADAKTYYLQYALSYAAGEPEPTTEEGVLEINLQPPITPRVEARVHRQEGDVVVVESEAGEPLAQVETAWMKAGFFRGETELFPPAVPELEKKVKAPELKLPGLGQYFNVVIDEDDIVQLRGITIAELENQPEAPEITLALTGTQESADRRQVVITAEVSDGTPPFVPSLTASPALAAEPNLDTTFSASKTTFRYEAQIGETTVFTFEVVDALGKRKSATTTLELTNPTTNSLDITIDNRMAGSPAASIKVMGVETEDKYCTEAHCQYEASSPKSVQLGAYVNTIDPFKVTWTGDCVASANPKAAALEVRGAVTCNVKFEDAVTCNPTAIQPSIRTTYNSGMAAPYAEVGGKTIFFMPAGTVQFDGSGSTGARHPVYDWEFVGFTTAPGGEGAMRSVQLAAPAKNLEAKLRVMEDGCAEAPEAYRQLEVALCVCQNCGVDDNHDFLPDECAP